MLILLPRNRLIFSEAGAKLYRSFFAIRDDLPEVYRQLAYLLDVVPQDVPNASHRRAVAES